MTRINTEVRLDNNSSQVISKVKKPVRGFWDFLNRYSVVSLAIGVVIGQATKDVVNKMVDGIVTPALQLLLPNSEIQDLVITSNGAEFRIGEFIDALIQMFIIMLLIYIIFGLVFKDKKVVGSKKAKKKLHKNKNT